MGSWLSLQVTSGHHTVIPIPQLLLRVNHYVHYVTGDNNFVGINSIFGQ
jgi:hypothetical protein